jgi:peptidoglycan/LPS O-acetylase OafA/YrhL
LPPELQAAEYRRRWEFLDVVRGLAALLVVLQHSPVSFAKNHLSYGLAGVVAFFLVSGFIIPISLERYGSLLRFWVGRVLRILPLYYLCAVAVTFEAVRRYGVLFTSHMHWGRYIVANAMLLQHALHAPFAVDVSWTLTYEVAFYVVCSLLFAAGVQARSTLWLWVGMALSLAASAGYQATTHHALAATALGLIVTALYGTVVFRYFQGEVSRAAVLWPLPALFVLIGYMARAREVSSIGGVEDGLHAAGASSTLLSWALGFAVFGLAFLLRQRSFPGVLRWLGRISYSLYLVHGSLRPIWPYPLDSSLTGYPALVAVAVPLSWATFHLIEMPFNRLQHRLFPHRVIPLRTAREEEGTVHA